MTSCRPHRIVALAFLTACGGSDPITPPGTDTPTVTSVSVSPSGGSVAVGETLLYSATATLSTGGTQSNPSITWSSSSTSVATIASSGLATRCRRGQRDDHSKREWRHGDSVADGDGPGADRMHGPHDRDVVRRSITDIRGVGVPDPAGGSSRRSVPSCRHPARVVRQL